MEKNEVLNNNAITLCKIQSIGTDYSFKHEVVWPNAIFFLILHLFCLWGLVIILTGGVCFKTFLWAFFVSWFSGIGITVGAHRHFTHKTFKAKPVLRALLIILQTLAGENSMYVWCRDHRVHHRFSETDADPHNSNRGFFFSHIGWLMTKKHPYVIEFGKTVDMSDLQSDWMVMFQKKYYFILYALFAVLIPVSVPVYFFGDSLWNCLLVCYFSRYTIGLNITWLVNSAAHLYGTRPYDRNMQPVESWMVAFLALGEGWHNYHHAFPWDYNAAELTMHFNPSAKVIRFLEKIGLAYDLKTVTPEMVAERIKRTGDGTHYLLGNDDARHSVTAFGPLHPMNPTYNSTVKVPNAKHD